MKKKIGIIIGLVALFGVGGGMMLSNHAQDSNHNQVDLSKFGAALQKDYQKSEQNGIKKSKAKEEIYAKGNYSEITKSNMKKAIVYYKSAGMSNEEAEKEAYKYEKENAALYTEAIKAGYEVTDEEVADYVNNIRAEYEGKKVDETSLKQIDEIIAQFDSPEDYWKYEKTIYHELLPMIKYNKQLEKEYNEKHADASEEDWEKYFNNYKSELVKKEDFKLVK